jgi:hypothetical protein
MNELRTKIDNIKEEVTHDMENLRKKIKQIQTKWKTTPADWWKFYYTHVVIKLH